MFSPVAQELDRNTRIFLPQIMSAVAKVVPLGIGISSFDVVD
jgi:hypothetical protein